MKRKSNALKHLAKWIAAELRPDDEGRDYVLLSREWKPDSSRGLGSRTSDELFTLHGSLCRVIPDDFDFWFCFDNGAVNTKLLYLDGGQTCAAVPFPVRIDSRMFEILYDLDWEKQRTLLLNGNQLHEKLADDAGDYPIHWIPTSAVHETYREEIETYRMWLIEEGQSSGVLAANTDTRVLMNCPFENRPDRDRWVSQQMGQGNLILAIINDGVLLSAEETDILRRIELEKLPEIARAKAEGRFKGALDAMGQDTF